MSQRCRFFWTKPRGRAAVSLASGDTQQAAGEAAGVDRKTIQRWLAMPVFADEVERLTFLTDVAAKAERLRLAKRMISDLGEATEKDLLDWLKYIMVETDGLRLDLTDLLTAYQSVSTSKGK